MILDTPRAGIIYNRDNHHNNDGYNGYGYNGGVGCLRYSC